MIQNLLFEVGFLLLRLWITLGGQSLLQDGFLLPLDIEEELELLLILEHFLHFLERDLKQIESIESCRRDRTVEKGGEHGVFDQPGQLEQHVLVPLLLLLVQ